MAQKGQHHTEGNVNGLIDNFNIKLFSIQAGGTKVETDGARAKFGATYCACVDGDDAAKFMGSGIENISLERDGVSLVIEARPYITTLDTLYLKMEGMTVGGSYEFQFIPTNFDTSVAVCRVYDHFLNKDTIVSLSTLNSLPFVVTADAGSYAANRFSIVFYPTVALPTNTMNVGLSNNNNSIAINWENATDINVSSYNIEKSSNGKVFNVIGSVKSEGRITNTQYSYIDKNINKNSTNYYRVKAITNSASSYYSKVVFFSATDGSHIKMVAYPNPITSNSFSLSINTNDAVKGRVIILDIFGKIIFAKKLVSLGTNNQYFFALPTSIVNGLYTILLQDDKNEVCESKSILIRR